MANCVAGAIIFKGAQEDLEKLYSALIPDGKLSMSGILPVPESLVSEDRLQEGALLEESSVYVWAKDHPLSERNTGLLDALESYRTWDELLAAGNARAAAGSAEDKTNFVKLGRRCLSNLTKYKCLTKTEWCIKNWGVKWDFWLEDGENKLSVLSGGIMSLVIHTSEDFPFAFMDALARKFPTITFTGAYAGDEDDETVRGCISGSGGVLTVDKRPNDLNIYISLWNEEEEF